MFCLGALVSLVPFFFASRRPALITSVVLSAIVLLALGLYDNPHRPLAACSSIRQLRFGMGAAAITYAIGRAVGGAVG